MFPHSDTVCAISALDYQERLREAAKERIAASAQVGAHSPLSKMSHVVLAAASWLGRVATRLTGARRAQVSPPLASSQARSAGHAV